MSVSLTIRNVPAPVRDELAARAAARGQSLQQYLLSELVDLARRPTVADVLSRARARKAATASGLSPGRILTHLRRDRR
jgi:plasmid stability protein